MHLPECHFTPTDYFQLSTRTQSKATVSERMNMRVSRLAHEADCNRHDFMDLVRRCYEGLDLGDRVKGLELVYTIHSVLEGAGDYAVSSIKVCFMLLSASHHRQMWLLQWRHPMTCITFFNSHISYNLINTPYLLTSNKHPVWYNIPLSHVK